VTVGVRRNIGYGGKNSSDFAGLLTVGGADLFIDDRPVVRGGRLAEASGLSPSRATA
jgi:hypothetical protein